MVERLDRGKNYLTVLRNIAGFLSGVLLAFSPIFIFKLMNNYSSEYYNENSRSFIKMGKFIVVFSVTFAYFYLFLPMFYTIG